ncbi:hypothetical protein M5K25_015713 [Dendrobium thyrsiflorum]|uniref:Uncharacterized protein n=1 Tax=Dendrobium thyrsiflorum TaxID=117978 RepID=A0ABD0UXY1_DENTH
MPPKSEDGWTTDYSFRTAVSDPQVSGNPSLGARNFRRWAGTTRQLLSDGLPVVVERRQAQQAVREGAEESWEGFGIISNTGAGFGKELLVERDSRFIYDDQGRVDVLRSPYFDPYPEWDLTIDDYLHRIRH